MNVTIGNNTYHFFFILEQYLQINPFNLRIKLQNLSSSWLFSSQLLPISLRMYWLHYEKNNYYKFWLPGNINLHVVTDNWPWLNLLKRGFQWFLSKLEEDQSDGFQYHASEVGEHVPPTKLTNLFIILSSIEFLMGVSLTASNLTILLLKYY